MVQQAGGFSTANLDSSRIGTRGRAILQPPTWSLKTGWRVRVVQCFQSARGLFGQFGRQWSGSHSTGAPFRAPLSFQSGPRRQGSVRPSPRALERSEPLRRELSDATERCSPAQHGVAKTRTRHGQARQVQRRRSARTTRGQTGWLPATSP